MVNRGETYIIYTTEFITINYIKKKTSYPESLVNVTIFQNLKMKIRLIFS